LTGKVRPGVGGAPGSRPIAGPVGAAGLERSLPLGDRAESRADPSSDSVSEADTEGASDRDTAYPRLAVLRRSMATTRVSERPVRGAPRSMISRC